jgi:hypothetical protein
MITETIDRLFLELSQVTSAKTERELRLERAVRQLLIDIDAGDKGGYFAKLRSVDDARKLVS